MKDHIPWRRRKHFQYKTWHKFWCKQ